MSRLRLVACSVVAGLVVALTACAPAGATPASGTAAETEPATSYWALGQEGLGYSLYTAPAETFETDLEAHSSAHFYQLTATTAGEVEGGIDISSDQPITPGSYSLAGNTHFSFSYVNGDLQTGPLGLTGVVRILRLNFSRVDGLPAAELAVTFAVRTPTSARPVFGSLGIDTTLPLGVPGETAKESLGDFNGDGYTDVAVFRPSTGQWFIRGHQPITYGRAGDTPVPGDYNGDGSSDIAVWRPSTGQWFIRGNKPITYGRAGDKPVQSDYNSDGSTDIAVWRPSTGQWFVRGASTITYGASGDIPAESNWRGLDSYAGGSRKAVFRPSAGQWLLHGAGTITWGIAGDIPVPGQYDGSYGNNYQAEAAVFRPSNGMWYLDTRQGPVGHVIIAYGKRGDIPV